MADETGEDLPEDFDEMMETARTEKVRKTKHTARSAVSNCAARSRDGH
jgi:hypothetical protein